MIQKCSLNWDYCLNILGTVDEVWIKDKTSWSPLSSGYVEKSHSYGGTRKVCAGMAFTTHFYCLYILLIDKTIYQQQSNLDFVKKKRIHKTKGF